MAICNQCHTLMTPLGAEAFDGVYEIHSWLCTACGHELDIAMACVETYDFPSFCLTEPDDPDWLALLPLALNAQLESRAMQAH
ncbi:MULTISPECIES: hypothetical protein [Rhodopseudomonas]|uniref:Uncharacterized protein n=1 Tax=Rhodopseudomonas palustris TaxID=1076 RepID=A0A0D7EEG8_RHOPL|nr:MULTISPECIES: hypothetical protein [Rhodopseudomonas]KIZ38915.1 hypothetical protein OO17_22055 [Rhodopseudomonas palustris]MDF3811726.1 hypothetical protein [Rhodopseudomonas sp. BAL398]WOK17565.1 hypothetical protein RBJ75_26175 [Rhodopseudomonas sp. BAL398]